MRDAVIVEAVRTPVGKRNGGLAGVHPTNLSADILNALVGRAGIDPVIIDDVMWGCVHQVATQTYNVARNAIIAAGWPESVPGVTMDRQCGSSQQAVHAAAAAVISGQADIVVAGGVELMSTVTMGSSLLGEDPFGDRFAARYDGATPNMGLGAESIAEKWNLSRTQLDEFALASHEKAAIAQKDGLFDREIFPIVTPDGLTVSADEGIRPGGNLEKLGSLKTPFKEGGRITAASSSQISDGAAALLIMTSEKAKELGLKPIARIHTAVLAGADPIISLTALIPATQKALAKSGMTIDDIDVFEVSEAFASVPLAWLADTGADPAKLNVRGGAISIGHPLGASGARLMTSLVNQMRDNNLRFGLQTMCEGGGLSNATILELI
ncbi:thiolase family protein [soil metagenome]